MAFFKWDPSLETGNAEIDEQHRTMFELANKLHVAVTGTAASPEAVEDAIYRLTDYVLEHFTDEEALMTRLRYPAVGSHEGLHKSLTADTMRLAASYFNGDPLAATKIGPFVTSWLKDHIVAEDLAFAAFARTRSGSEDSSA